MLAFYESLFPNLPPLVFEFLKRKRDKVVIYTDDSCSARHYGLGFIMIMDGQRIYLNTVTPPWIIHILENVIQSPQDYESTRTVGNVMCGTNLW